MLSGPGDLAVALIDLLHVSLLPAGVGLVLALVVASRRGSAGVGPGSDEARLRDLRAMAAAGVLAAVATSSDRPPAPDHEGDRRPAHADRGAAASAAVQLAVLATACSAVVHAMAGPPHAAENLAFGVFFEVVAVAQFAWAGLALIAPGRRLWGWGVVSNAALVLLWLATRTYGLPFGLLDGPEAIGRWDLASKGWELVALGCCWWLSRSPSGGLGSLVRPARTYPAPRLVPVGALVSLGALLALALSGPPT